MSDKPLFKDADAQEAAYAPDQLPADDPAARVPGERVRDGEPVDGAVVVPAAAAVAVGGGVAGGSTGVGGSTAAGPAIAGVALADQAAREGDPVDRREDDGVNDADGQTPSG